MIQGNTREVMLRPYTTEHIICPEVSSIYTRTVSSADLQFMTRADYSHAC
jgi:hypothetical protein